MSVYCRESSEPIINPCVAKTVYIRFQSNSRLNKIPLKFVAYFFAAAAQLIKYFNLGHVYFS